MHGRLYPHAASRLAERGATEAEVVTTVTEGEPFPVKDGRAGFRRNFPFAAEGRGRHYGTKQIEAYYRQAPHAGGAGATRHENAGGCRRRRLVVSGTHDHCP